MTDSKNVVTDKKYINSFRGLEILRFILSFAVIIWHYQHFFYPYVSFANRVLFFEKQPFFKSLSLFYSEGLYAVHIFWFISGLIFYTVYNQRISEGKIKFNIYMLNRFSRLYPLHFLTLLLVAVLQYVYYKSNGNYFIYQENTLKTFFQNLLFMQSWGVNKFSYNGPTWSVSIEILVYIVFFVLAAVGFLTKSRGLIMTFIFFAVLKKWELVYITEDIVTCFYFFFAGSLFIKFYSIYQHNIKVQLIALCTSIFAYIFILKTPPVFQKITNVVTGRLDIDILLFSIIVILSFLLIFNLRFFDKISNKYFQFFGDLTYSTYLIHFPVQLLIYIILKPTNYTIFFSESFFVFYMITVFICGKLFFNFFELPVQKLIRNKF